MSDRSLPHIIVPVPPSILKFVKPPQGGPESKFRSRNRQKHSEYLSKRFAQAWRNAEREQAVLQADRAGVYLEFKSDPGFSLHLPGLEDLRSKKVRLLNVRTEKSPKTDDNAATETTYATVYIANDARQHFVKRISEYAREETEKGKPRYQRLVESIADIRKAVLKSFWQDDPGLIPEVEREWCEVWLRSDSDGVREQFFSLVRQYGIQIADESLVFPERIVVMARLNRNDLERLLMHSDHIAEYRLAKEVTSFWTELDNRQQAEWVRDLLERLHVKETSDISICLLDTGVNKGHPLLAPILADKDALTVDESWGTHDHHRGGHGTPMAGLAAYGDLKRLLSSDATVRVTHLLESCKILPPPPRENERKLWGHITAQGVYRAEINAPDRKRILCLATTATDTRDRGRPTSWSARLDQLASGVDGEPHRLFIIAAGNTVLPEALSYPTAQQEESVHDPAQSWNSLTVGAYTRLDQIQQSDLTGYEPVASMGGLSPFTSTSVHWDQDWPIKPEILLEGGNLARDPNHLEFATEAEDLSVLTTSADITTAHFQSFSMTSAATAQASWMAAQIQEAYPNLWPETIRALLVHSAEWTEQMKEQFLPDHSKTSYARLLRTCGYGVPNLQRALHSAGNSLTLIAQNHLQPYHVQGGRARTNEMHLYELPWPKDVLLTYADMDVEMRVTLSYFIEPGPGEIGWRDRYRYPSHGFRFDINSPNEDADTFTRRINKEARGDGEQGPGTPSAADKWVIGSTARDKGSIHSDIWRGSAGDLATSNIVGVFPVIGWWRERRHLGRVDSRSRYSLVVSITTSEQGINIYNSVKQQLRIHVPVQVHP